jgi:hypothetical protein
MSEITNAQTTTPAPQQQDTNPFEAYGNAMAPRMIVGRLLKFSQGFNFQAGQNGVEVPVGTVLAAIMPTLTAGWVKWEGALPTEQIMGLVADGFTPPSARTSVTATRPHGRKTRVVSAAIPGS